MKSKTMSGTGKSDEAWIEKAAIQIANKGDNMAFWRNRVDFSAHEIKKIIEGCLREARQHSAVSSDTLTPQGEATSGVQATSTSTGGIIYLTCHECGKDTIRYSTTIDGLRCQSCGVAYINCNRVERLNRKNDTSFGVETPPTMELQPNDDLYCFGSATAFLSFKATISALEKGQIDFAWIRDWIERCLASCGRLPNGHNVGFQKAVEALGKREPLTSSSPQTPTGKRRKQ